MESWLNLDLSEFLPLHFQHFLVERKKRETMKKILFFVLAVFSLTLMAGVQAPFVQYTAADYSFADKPTQETSQFSDMITLKVSAGQSVWLTNIIDTWYGENPGLDEIFDMGQNRYGYFKATDSIINAEIEKSDYAANGIQVKYGNGTTTSVTFYDDSLPTRTVTATAYLLDTFTQDTEIFLAMTPLEPGSTELVDMYQFTTDAAHEDTILQSRKLTSHEIPYPSSVPDFAGNVRVNFGTVTGGYEFTVVFSDPIAPVGQPLPGLLVAGLLSLGTITLGSKAKKR